MKCPHCNTTDHPKDGRYCHICGTTLTNATMTATGQGLDSRNASPNKAKRYSGQPNPAKAKASPTGGYWACALRYLLLSCLLIEAILFSLKERQLESGWWITAILLVNIPAFFCSLSLCISTDKYGNDPEKGFWRLYHDWLHIPAAALVIVLGYLVICNIQNMLTFLLTGLLMLALIGSDFE